MGFTAPSGWNIWKMRFEKQSEGESDMKYYSTRDAAVRMDAAEAIKMGLSRDGGLLTPCEIPQIDRAFLESLVNVRYQERAAKVMGLYLTDYTYEELSGFAENAYGPEKFDCDAVAPVRTVDETTHCLELWHGPTSAFKDMALQMLPQLLSAALRKTGESKTVCILVATSGDTGKAAMEGFADVPQTKILVFYPKDGVSKVQETQMVTQDGANVGVCAVEGNFDDAQAGVKRIFSDEAIRATLADRGYFLSSANSINWGRILPQVVYYISAYCDLVRDDLPKGRFLLPGRAAAPGQSGHCAAGGMDRRTLGGHFHHGRDPGPGSGRCWGGAWWVWLRGCDTGNCGRQRGGIL